MAIAEFAPSGIDIQAISVFSTLKSPQEDYCNWISEYQEEIRQALSVETGGSTKAQFLRQGFFSITTELGEEKDYAAILTSIALEKIVTTHLLSWGINYRRFLTGPWMAEDLERTSRQGRFYQMDILPPNYGIRLKGYDLSLAEDPLSTLITPFGGIIRLRMSGQVISVYSPLEAIFHQNNNGQHPL